MLYTFEEFKKSMYNAERMAFAKEYVEAKGSKDADLILKIHDELVHRMETDGDFVEQLYKDYLAKNNYGF